MRFCKLWITKWGVLYKIDGFWKFMRFILGSITNKRPSMFGFVTFIFDFMFGFITIHPSGNKFTLHNVPFYYACVLDNLLKILSIDSF
jgi:hypothetical protein